MSRVKQSKVKRPRVKRPRVGYIRTDDDLVHSQIGAYGTGSVLDCEDRGYRIYDTYTYLPSRCTMLGGTKHVVTCLSCIGAHV